MKEFLALIIYVLTVMILVHMIGDLQDENAALTQRVEKLEAK